MNLDEAINEAAGDLPEGWIIQLNVENGAAWIDLITPYGNAYSLDDCTDDTLAERIKAATVAAVVGQKELNALHVTEGKEQWSL